MSLQDLVRARLTNAQLAALHHVEGTIQERLVSARTRVASVLTGCGCSEATYDAAVDGIRRHARVVVHFHPDRIGLQARTVAEGLLEDGQYRNQFETGLSSGSPTAFSGGARDTWEETLFGGAYHGSDASTGERPKYGALELIRYPDGPWPRFGSCYFVLREEVSWRTSFTFSGSEQPAATDRLGTIDKMDCVLAPLLTEIASGATAQVPWPPFLAPTLGIKDLTVNGLLACLSNELALSRANPSSGAAGRVLDSGIEAQVHGPIEMKGDIEQLVVDPAFIGTRTGDHLRELAQQHDFPLAWHCGFNLAAKNVPGDFRGPAIPRLAQRIARDGNVDAAALGAAQQSVILRPDEWQGWGPQADILQHLKQLWHVLVHFGHPARLEH
jgi:hypothetical protein